MNDKTSLKQLFSDYYPIAGSTFEIALAKRFDKYCIVEGSDDRLFYSNIKGNFGEKLFNNTYFVYQKHSKYKKILEGKKRVLKSYQLINNNKSFGNLKSKMYFIVDKDLDEIEHNKYISVTKYYAFENYFFIKENLKKIFLYLGLTNNDYDNFESVLSYYIKLTQSFYEYSYTITYNYNILKNNKLKRFEDREILLFTNNECKLTKNDYTEKRFIDIEKLKDEVLYKKNLVEQYTLNSDIFKNSSIYTIKGHHLYSLLESYLKIVHNKDINNNNLDLYSKIVKKINVEMDFINCLGEKI